MLPIVPLAIEQQLELVLLLVSEVPLPHHHLELLMDCKAEVVAEGDHPERLEGPLARVPVHPLPKYPRSYLVSSTSPVDTALGGLTFQSYQRYIHLNHLSRAT